MAFSRSDCTRLLPRFEISVGRMNPNPSQFTAKANLRHGHFFPLEPCRSAGGESKANYAAGVKLFLSLPRSPRSGGTPVGHCGTFCDPSDAAQRLASQSHYPPPAVNPSGPLRGHYEVEGTPVGWDILGHCRASAKRPRRQARGMPRTPPGAVGHYGAFFPIEPYRFAGGESKATSAPGGNPFLSSPRSPRSGGVFQV
jgi:hypothetical protein